MLESEKKNLLGIMDSDIIGSPFVTEILGVTETNFIDFDTRNKARGPSPTDLIWCLIADSNIGFAYVRKDENQIRFCYIIENQNWFAILTTSQTCLGFRNTPYYIL